MTQARQACQQYRDVAIGYICTMSVGLPLGISKACHNDPRLSSLAHAVDAALAAEDVRATKIACRAWWTGWQEAIKAHTKGAA